MKVSVRFMCSTLNSLFSMDKEVIVIVPAQEAQIMKSTGGCNSAKSLEYPIPTGSQNLVYTHSWS
jgi:hypothetical protein